jgi:1-deoxy-D-xylulose-5-phosphate reductoisomerase
MGKKITVDSATLLNKGFEVIEAHYLYNMPYSHIKTVIQPQSIIHSMVEFEDGAILAQMSKPSMRLPIQLALTYPERLECDIAPMDFTQTFALNFFPLVREKFPMFDLALACGEEGGVLPTALNAACEVAVYAFLEKKIPFTGIYKVADKVVFGTKSGKVESYAQLAELDDISRKAANKIIATEF